MITITKNDSDELKFQDVELGEIFRFMDDVDLEDTYFLLVHASSEDVCYLCLDDNNLYIAELSDNNRPVHIYDGELILTRKL